MTHVEEDHDPDPLTTLQRMARALHLKDASVDATLAAVVDTAVRTIPAADVASVNLITRGKFKQRAATADPAEILGAFEQEHQLGPCTDAASDQLVIRVDDMTEETRWPTFNELAVATGVLSMLCVPLWVADQQLGSLTLYATRRAAFSETDAGMAGVFAGYAALALADARRSDNLNAALLNRDVIGQAKGVLMERHRITADAGFELLSQASQRLNRKLSDVAEHLVATGELL